MRYCPGFSAGLFLHINQNQNKFYMKKIIYCGLLLCFSLLLVNFAATAQKEGKTFSAGFGLEGGLPLGDVKDVYHFSGGLTLRFAYHVGPGFVTLTTGAIAYVPKSFQGDDTKASIQIPVKAGYKYIFYKPFFVMGEVGYSSYKIYYEGSDGNLASNTSGGFTYAPTVGVNLNVFELGIKYEATHLTGGTVSTVGLRLGFNF